MSFPLLVRFQDRLLITPTRLQIAYMLMDEKIRHKQIHKQLNQEYEINFQNKIQDILSKLKYIVQDPFTSENWANIIDKKKNTFEFDILALNYDLIIVVECKSIRMSPFYNLVTDRRRRESQFLKFETQFNNKIKPWLLENLKIPPKDGFIKVNCRKRDLSEITLHIPKTFYNISEEKIYGLYITQLDEYFKKESDIIQIYFKNLEDFIKNIDNS